VDHAQIGHEWLSRNKFQRAVRYLVAFHEQPENCYQALAESSKMHVLASMISSTDDYEINRLAHLVYCANILTKELGLGYSGNPLLDQVPWIDQPTTQLIFESRQKEEVTLEEFKEFFMVTCRELPDLPFTQLAHAQQAKERTWEKHQREEKGKK
jgi:hypothetical protein